MNVDFILIKNWYKSTSSPHLKQALVLQVLHVIDFLALVISLLLAKDLPSRSGHHEVDILEAGNY